MKFPKNILPGKWSWIALILAFFLVYICMVRLADSYNQFPYGNWKSELHGDRAGYYIYLPAAFLHGFYEPAYPEGIDDRMGNGFRFVDGKLFDKYPMGVAVLVSPFFLGAHFLALNGKGPADGFSGNYYEMTYYASVFYFLAGALILLVYLKRRFSLWVSSMTLLLLMFSTNLYYYAFRDPLLSHVYSFALFSLLLLLIDNLWKSPSSRRLLPVMLVGSMILLVRPSNIIFLPVILFLGLGSPGELKERLKFIFRPPNLLLSILIPLLIFTPQMLYWNFLSGRFLFNTYQGEGFTFWDHPQLAKVLTSPANGLLTYSPAYFLILPGTVIMFLRKETNRWLVPVIFMLLLYMTASWYTYRFGCSFGQRQFVEYLALFSLPVASLLRWSFRKIYPFMMIVLLILIGYLIYVNISLSGVYQRCHFGSDWEWPAYRIYYLKADIFPFCAGRESYIWHDDFESQQQTFSTRYNIVPFEEAYSGKYVSKVDTAVHYSDGFKANLEFAVPGRVRKVDVSFMCFFGHPPEKALLVCSIDKDGQMLVHHTARLDDRPGLLVAGWNRVEHSFEMDDHRPVGLLKVYVWLVKGSELYIDDMKVTIHSESGR